MAACFDLVGGFVGKSVYFLIGVVDIKSVRLKGSLFCISASIIWGLSFVAQKVSTGAVGAFTFNGIRMYLGCAVLLPLVIKSFKREKAARSAEDFGKYMKTFFIASAVCGLFLFIGNNLQQTAFAYLESGKVGFITALYMILVPVFSLVVFRKKARINVWIAVAVGIVGMYFLCISKGAPIAFGTGETLTLLCAVAFAFHIIAIGHFAKETDAVLLSFAQFFVAAVLSTVCMFIFETPEKEAVLSVAPQILYSGIMSCGLAFTFQTFGQKYTEPAVASILLSMESVFAVISGWLILHEVLSGRELLGCIIMFSAIILAQLPEKKKSGARDS